MDGLNADARVAYFKMFNRSSPPPADAYAAFDHLYTKWYGRKYFIAPGLLLILVAAISVIVIVLTGLHTLHYLPDAR
jgi:hypothetical protein